MRENLAAALCYVLGLITGVLFLVLEPYNRNSNVRFHAFQSIFLNVAIIAILIAVSIAGGAIAVIIPFLGHFLIGALSWLIWLGGIVLWIVMIVKTYGGTRIVLPVIGPLAQKQAG